MDPQTARALIELAKTGVSLSTSGWVVLVIVVLAASFIGAYLADKGRNLATKEDIATITRMVEEVKASFAAQAEDHAQHNRLRLAALDRRLETHQQAYAHWHKLLDAVYSDRILDVVNDCRTWWIENCLYLGPDVRDAFVDAWLAACRHADLLRAQTPKEELYKNWDQLQSCGDRIIRGAGLPGFAMQEKEQIAPMKA